jgi:hypothetical protein
MITYDGGAFGYRLLFRLHGSAVFKSLTPALLSSIIYILLYSFSDLNEDQIFDHPYPMAALVTAFSFLLVFRANFSYNRYWEACTAVHVMHSKWLDFATEIAAFHYQSEMYNHRKPPAFGAHPNVTTISRERERKDEMTKEELVEHIDAMDTAEPSLRSRFRFLTGKRKKKNDAENNTDPTSRKDSTRSEFKSINKAVPKGGKKNKKRGNEKYDENGKPYSSFKVAARKQLYEGNLNPDNPPLFLEEAAHLLSLLSAVAFCKSLATYA